MRCCRGLAAWALALTVLLATGPVHALTIWDIGAPGTAGAAGVDGTAGDPADAIASSSDATNSAIAQAGHGGTGGAGAVGGAGGAASAFAEANVCEPAGAYATATAGDGGGASGSGGQAADGGAATAQASAAGVGGSEAGVFATAGAGGEGEGGALAGAGGGALLTDAVSGSDAVALSLTQSASGGAGGWAVTRTYLPSYGVYVYHATGTGGDGGDARSTGDFTNAAGGDLFVSLEAIAGDGGWGLERGDGGAAHAGGSATSVGNGDVSLVVKAQTGSGFREGALTIDPVFATASGSGDASVDLDARLGAARDNPYHTTPSAPLSLINRVDAVASAAAVISMRQSVTASGGAESILDVSKSAARLDLEANATGGDASIVVRGTNDAGGLRLSGQAIGGDAYAGGAPLDAHAVFEALTTGDGHDIEIGYAGRPAGAIGGGANNPIVAGNARVDAKATALGNSAVKIEVSALGGDGTDFVGGDAVAIAAGTGAGAQPVHVFVTATGNEGFYGPGGDARAEASAFGAGEVVSRAKARGGISSPASSEYGSAFALAQASGATGYAEAIASSERLYSGEQADDEQIARVQTAIRAAVPDGVTIAASTHFQEFAAGALAGGVDASMHAVYTPTQALLEEALSGNPRAAAAPFPQPWALRSLVEFRASAREGVTQTFAASIMFGSPHSGFQGFEPRPEGMLVSFLDPEIDAAGFGSLTLRSWDRRAPGDVYEVSFASALDALAFFDDGRLAFGGEPRERILELVFETSGLEGELFLDFIVAAVPEPGLPLLLGLAALATVRLRRCGRGVG